MFLVSALLESAAQNKRLFRARLSVVPIDVAMQNTIAGSGTASATLDGATLSVAGTFADLKTPATVARIHQGAKGIRGPVIFELSIEKATRGTFSGTVALAPAQVEALARSALYLQIHSEKAADGNLWGWLLPIETRR